MRKPLKLVVTLFGSQVQAAAQRRRDALAEVPIVELPECSCVEVPQPPGVTVRTIRVDPECPWHGPDVLRPG